MISDRQAEQILFIGLIAACLTIIYLYTFEALLKKSILQTFPQTLHLPYAILGFLWMILDHIYNALGQIEYGLDTLP